MFLPPDQFVPTHHTSLGRNLFAATWHQSAHDQTMNHQPIPSIPEATGPQNRSKRAGEKPPPVTILETEKDHLQASSPITPDPDEESPPLTPSEQAPNSPSSDRVTPIKRSPLARASANFQSQKAKAWKWNSLTPSTNRRPDRDGMPPFPPSRKTWLSKRPPRNSAPTSPDPTSQQGAEGTPSDIVVPTDHALVMRTSPVSSTSSPRPRAGRDQSAGNHTFLKMSSFMEKWRASLRTRNSYTPSHNQSAVTLPLENPPADTAADKSEQQIEVVTVVNDITDVTNKPGNRAWADRPKTLHGSLGTENGFAANGSSATKNPVNSIGGEDRDTTSQEGTESPRLRAEPNGSTIFARASLAIHASSPDGTAFGKWRRERVVDKRGCESPWGVKPDIEIDDDGSKSNSNMWPTVPCRQKEKLDWQEGEDGGEDAWDASTDKHGISDNMSDSSGPREMTGDDFVDFCSVSNDRNRSVFWKGRK